MAHRHGGGRITRWLLNRSIPRTVVVPTNEALGVSSRPVEVSGVGTYPKCPNCGRDGPVDALTLGNGAEWPNVVVVCGRLHGVGCGVWWALTPNRPLDLRTVV